MHSIYFSLYVKAKSGYLNYLLSGRQETITIMGLNSLLARHAFTVDSMSSQNYFSTWTEKISENLNKQPVPSPLPSSNSTTFFSCRSQLSLWHKNKQKSGVLHCSVDFAPDPLCELCLSTCTQKGNASIPKSKLVYKHEKEQLNRSIGTETRSRVENTPQTKKSISWKQLSALV